MLPFRSVLESIGCYVDWDGGRNTVIVSINAVKPDTQGPITVDKSTPFSNGVAAVETGGKWGLIGGKGELVSEFVWDSMELPPYGNNSNIAALFDLLSSDYVLIKVSQDGKYGLIDTKGNIIVKAVWDNVGLSPLTWDEYVTGSTDGMIPVKLNDKWGFIAKNTGEVAIVPRFEEHDGIAPFFSEGLALVYINEEYSFINKTGDVVIMGRWDNVSPFINGFAAFTLGDELGIIDASGKVLTKLTGSLVDIPSGTPERFLVRTDEGNIIIDQYGNVLIPAQPTTWRPKFNNGLAAIYKNGVTNIVGASDIDGNIIINYESYENSSAPFGMKLTVGNDGKAYVILFIDLQQIYGFSSPYISLDVKPYSDSLMPLLDFKDGKFGFTDKDGNVIIAYNYEMAMPFVNGIAAAGSRDSRGFINRDGTLLPIDYSDPAYDSNPLAYINEPVGTGLFDNFVQGRPYFPDGMRYIY